MHPWLLTFPPVSTYGTCIVVGLVLAWLWARRRARLTAIDPSRVDLLIPLIVGVGLLGAWLFGWLADAATGEEQHAAVLVGSLLLATGAGVAYGFASRIPLGMLGDICAAPLALGIGIGRLGCFFAGCCFGKVCEHPTMLTAVRFPAGSFAYVQQVRDGLLSLTPPAEVMSLPVYPVQIYESLGCVGLALMLAFGRGPFVAGKPVTGERFLAMGIGYGVLRFWLEFLRGDNPAVAGMTFSQWATMGIVALAAGTWMLRRRYTGTWNLPLQSAAARARPG